MGEGHISAWLACERYANEGTRDYSAHAQFRDLPREYDPVIGDVDFELSFYSFRGVASPGCGQLEDGAGNILLPVHPAVVESFHDLPKASLKVRAIPTANARTVYVPEIHAKVGGKFLKMHYPRRLSRFVRALSIGEARFEVASSQMAHELGLPVLRDAGFVGATNHDAAAIVRDTSIGVWRKGLQYMPLFSLYGGSPISLAGEWRAPAVPARTERMSPEELAEFVVVPLFSLFADVYFRLRSFPSLHGQNVILGVEGGIPVELGFRGGSMFVTQDSPLLKEVAVPPRKCVRETEIGKVASLVFDGFICNHVLERICTRLASHNPSAIRAFRALSRAAFRDKLAELLEWPSQEYYYGPGGHDLEEPLVLTPTGRTPRWR